MSAVASAPRVAGTSLGAFRGIAALLPGLVLLGVIGYAGKLAESGEWRKCKA